MKPSLDKTMHEALSSLLDQGILQRMGSLGLGPKPPMRPLGCGCLLCLTCPGRWPQPAVPAGPRPTPGVTPRALQGGCTRVGAVGPPESSQQLPLGDRLEGPKA
ncbi:hypothetical protein LIER_22262 [Lithospermum erythrorhizon]|uniref:Uncharacterized protein n=1 Tax=Lithospermum erythrorhizon TaxID=34254 RepID=A0AAV3QUS1_LITER